MTPSRVQIEVMPYKDTPNVVKLLASHPLIGGDVLFVEYTVHVFPTKVLTTEMQMSNAKFEALQELKRKVELYAY